MSLHYCRFIVALQLLFSFFEAYDSCQAIEWYMPSLLTQTLYIQGVEGSFFPLLEVECGASSF